jgi:uroporphyrinogen-III synthase
LSNDKQVAKSKIVGTNKSPCPIIAVGEATASILQAANYEVLQPTMASNESMLAMPKIARLQTGDKVLIWRGLGGRRLLVDTLQERGIQVDSIAFYERVLPDLAMMEYEQWLTHDLTLNSSMTDDLVIDSSIVNSEQSVSFKPIVVISSGTTFEHWRHTVNQSKYSDIITLADFNYVVLGVRLAKMLARRQLDYWQVADLFPETILATINLPKAHRY